MIALPIAQYLHTDSLSLVTAKLKVNPKSKPLTTMLLIAAFSLVIATPAYAGTGLGDFFSWITGWGEDLYQLVSNDVPNMFERMYAWLVYWVTFIKISLMISSIQFSWGVAKVILDDFGWTLLINTLLTRLPQDTQALIYALKLPTAFEWVLTAYLTRFVRQAI